jgi:hypothetical protein
MSNLKSFLKALKLSGYPNTSPNTKTIAKMIDYPIDFFLKDLIGNIGEEGTEDFITKTFSTLGLMNNQGMKIDLSDIAGEEGSYIYLIVNDFNIIIDDDEDEVWISYTWGDSHLIHDGEVKTLEDIYDEVDLGTMSEYGDFVDEIEDVCRNEIFEKTGLVIHFDGQI